MPINDIEFTKDELQDLYFEYKITENDIKFAMDELPHYLEGTILVSDNRVIASETGEPPEGLKEGEDYDILITTEEMTTIIENAKRKYIEEYGVNTANPKVDVINGYPLPKEEVKKLVEKGIIKPETDDSVSVMQYPLSSVQGNPYAIGDILYEHVFIAKDSGHSPTEDFQQDTNNALSRFENLFGVDIIVYWHWNFWDASDISPSDSSYEALKDLKEDTSWIRDAQNDIVLGWAHGLDHNGRAYIGGSFAVCSDTTVPFNVEWPHDSIVQHEISHNFDATDQGRWWWEHPECIMNEWYALQGTNIWCDDCRAIVAYGIFH